MRRYIMSHFSGPKRKLENNSGSSSRRFRNFRIRQRRSQFNIPAAGARGIEMESSNPQTFNSNESVRLTSDDDDMMMVEEDEDLQLQQVLFNSSKFNSGEYLESSHASGKEVVESHDFVTNGVMSIHERGESSAMLCEICKDAFPPNTLLEGGYCHHYFCEECIVSYVGEQIKDDIHQVNCPVKGCNQILDLELLMPYDFLVRLEDAVREANALAAPLVIQCPFWWNCLGKLIDDRKGYLIRACPECWKIFCVRCRTFWHIGMTCEAYEFMINNQLNNYYSQIQECGDEQEQEDMMKEEIT